MIFLSVQRFMAGILGVAEDQIAPGTHLSRENGMDATSLAKLLLRCEGAFRVTIQDELMPDFVCVADLCDHIESLMKDGQDDYILPTDDTRTAWFYE